MLKALRKYNKWILVIGGTLLMMAFLVQPAIQQLGGDPGSRLWATLDGKKLRQRDAAQAAKELAAIEELTFGVFPSGVGVRDRNVRHWVLLVHEARLGGFLGEADDGIQWLPTLLADLQMERQYPGFDWRRFAEGNADIGRQLMAAYNQVVEQASATVERLIVRVQREHGMTEHEVRVALSKLRGVRRMEESYLGAARVSDARAAEAGRRTRDAAWVDYVFVPASVGVTAVPEPTDAELAAHFDRFKGVKPGEGEFGIGYLLPERIKLEWLTLDAAAIEKSIVLDPVAVNKRYLQDNRRTYRGDFAAERANVERDMKAERVDEVMREAHRTIQAEVLKVTRRLEADGRFKKLPEDWPSRRPRFEAIAPLVVEQVNKATGISIPLPAVTVRAADWMTREDLAAVPGLGSSAAVTGTLRVPAVEALFGVRELAPPDTPRAAESTLAVQVGVPIVETAFTGANGDRTYATVLDARRESAPDAVDDIRTRAVEDLKKLRSYESLASRVEEFRSLAAASGLQALVDLVSPPKPPADPPAPAGPDAASPDAAKPEAPAPAVRTRVQVTRERVQGFAPDRADVDVPVVREAIMRAAETLDPLAPPGSFDPAATMLAVAAPKRLGVVVARIIALAPLTLEAYRVADPVLEATTRAGELIADDGTFRDTPFTLRRLLQRHSFVAGDKQDSGESDSEAEPDGARG